MERVSRSLSERTFYAIVLVAFGLVMWWWAGKNLQETTAGSIYVAVGLFFVGLGALVFGGYLGRRILIDLVATQGSQPSAILESPASASMASVQTAGEVSSIGRGLLTLTQDDMIAFRKRNLLGAYDREPHHYYYLSNIVKVKGYGNGFHTEIYYDATDDEPAEVITYYYEPKDAPDRWLRVLAKKQEKPESPVNQQPSIKEIIREKEIVREIVKIRCRHCGELFEERINRCPNCGVPDPGESESRPVHYSSGRVLREQRLFSRAPALPRWRFNSPRTRHLMKVRHATQCLSG